MNPTVTAAGRRILEGRGNVQNCDSVSRSPWEPNCIIWMETHMLFLFHPHLLWYQNETQSKEDGILKQYILVITGKKNRPDYLSIRPTDKQCLQPLH